MTAMKHPKTFEYSASVRIAGAASAEHAQRIWSSVCDAIDQADSGVTVELDESPPEVYETEPEEPRLIVLRGAAPVYVTVNATESKVTRVVVNDEEFKWVKGVASMKQPDGTYRPVKYDFVEFPSELPVAEDEGGQSLWADAPVAERQAAAESARARTVAAYHVALEETWPEWDVGF